MDFNETYQDTCSSVGIAARNGDLGLVQQLVWHGTFFLTAILHVLIFENLKVFFF